MKKILVLAIFSCFLTACDQQEEAEVAQPSLIKINVVQPRMMEFSPTLKLTGSWGAKEDIAINPALQGVQILSVNTEVGSMVKKGQVLAILENNNVQSQLEQNNALLARAKANLASQQASLTEAQSILKRYQILSSVGFGQPSGIGTAACQSRYCKSGGECGESGNHPNSGAACRQPKST